MEWCLDHNCGGQYHSKHPYAICGLFAPSWNNLAETKADSWTGVKDSLDVSKGMQTARSEMLAEVVSILDGETWGMDEKSKVPYSGLWAAPWNNDPKSRPCSLHVIFNLPSLEAYSRFLQRVIDQLSAWPSKENPLALSPIFWGTNRAKPAFQRCSTCRCCGHLGNAGTTCPNSIPPLAIRTVLIEPIHPLGPVVANIKRALAAATGKDLRIQVGPSFSAQHPSRAIFIHSTSAEEAEQVTQTMYDLDAGIIADLQIHGKRTPPARPDCVCCGTQHKFSEQCPVGVSLISLRKRAPTPAVLAKAPVGNNKTQEPNYPRARGFSQEDADGFVTVVNDRTKRGRAGDMRCTKPNRDSLSNRFGDLTVNDPLEEKSLDLPLRSPSAMLTDRPPDTPPPHSPLPSAAQLRRSVWFPWMTSPPATGSLHLGG